MTYKQLPNIDNAWDNVEFSTLSPSTFSWVNKGCGYQIMLQKALSSFADPSLLLPFNKNAILGTIIHKIYELTTKGQLQKLADFQHKWTELVEAEKSKLVANYPTLRNANINDLVKRNSAFSYALKMVSSPTIGNIEVSTKKVYSEKLLDCSAIGLKGTADKVILDGDSFDVVDYKSGQVLDETNSIKEEYRVQLHLYAAMCCSLDMGKPRKLSLVDITGQYYNVPYEDSYCNSLLSDVKTTLDSLNAAVRSHDFQRYAKPDLGMCANCNCRHVCKFRDIPSDSVYQTFTGIVTSILSSNLYAIQNENEIFYISGLEVYSVDDPKKYIGKTLTFLNVVRASSVANGNTYKTTEYTLIYEQLQ